MEQQHVQWQNKNNFVGALNHVFPNRSLAIGQSNEKKFTKPYSLLHRMESVAMQLQKATSRSFGMRTAMAP